MNRHRIEQLARMLPANAGVFATTDQPGPTPGLAARLAIAVNTPDFAHRLVLHHIVRGKPLPPSVHESWLRRAYSHYAGANVVSDRMMVQIEQLTVESNQFARWVLNALLMCRDCTSAQIAEWLGLDEQAILGYSELHWNTKDWSAVQTARLIFPTGRYQLLKPDAMAELPFAQHLQVAAHLQGYKEVIWLAGLDKRQDPPSAEKSLRELEAAILGNALELTRAGALNAKSAPGLGSAKILLASKRNDAAKQVSHALPDISLLGNAITMTMRTTEGEDAAALAGCLERLKAAEAKLGINPPAP